MSEVASFPAVAAGAHHAVRRRWLSLGIGLGAIVALYAPQFPALVGEWASFPNLSHGFAIPVIAGYLAWLRRDRFAQCPLSPSWWGTPIVVLGFALYVIGFAGGEPFLARVSLPVSLSGTIFLLAGPSMAAASLPSIAYLLFMIPLPYVTLKALTEHAKLFDAALSASTLSSLGIPVFRDGTFLHLPHMTLEVADVCSSIPAIASLLALGAAYGIVRSRSRAICAVLLVVAVPLAIVSNVLRIVVTALGVFYLGPIAIDNVVHAWNGTTVFFMTFAGLVLVDTLLHRVVGRR